jgi:PKD repeat protein
MNCIKHLLTFCFAIIYNLCSSQNQCTNWYFGNQAGVTFVNGAPAVSSTGILSTDEGCSTMSDTNGNLLFYTDGISVWNALNSQMSNGFSLMGNSDATQAALIVKVPLSQNLYYIFTVTNEANPNGLRYSIVDMSLNGGLGNVTSKNILMQTPTTEKITAVKHANSNDIWIITHDWLSNAFRCFLLTATGINPNSVISNIGTIHNGSTWNTNGYMKASPNGKKLAVAICHFINKFELFDFNDSSGVVSNVVSFPSYPATIGAYGIEFSPDGTKLFGSIISSPKIYQFNLCAGSSAAIINSATIIGTSPDWLCALQLAPDGKIYVARCFTGYLGVINNPNGLGMTCNYIDSGFSLGTKTANLGLPAFESSLFSSLKEVDRCSGDTTFFYLNNLNNITSVVWNFNDPSSGIYNTSTLFNPYHVFANPGTYGVSIIRYNNLVSVDTFQICTVINSCNSNIQCHFISSDTIFCDKKCIDFIDLSTNNPTSWNWYFPGANPGTSNLQNPINICYNSYGSFDVSLTTCNSSSCDSLYVSNFIKEFQSPAIPTISQSADTLYSSLAYSYQWYNSLNPANILSSMNFLVCTIPGSYYVIVCDSFGCCSSSELYLINGIENDGTHEEIILKNNGENIILEIHLNSGLKAKINIYNQLGSLVYHSNIISSSGDVEKKINTKSFSKGIYLISLSTLKCSRQMKFVVY